MVTVMLTSALIEGKVSCGMIKRYKTRWIADVLKVLPTIFVVAFAILVMIQIFSFGTKEYYQIMVRNTLVVVNLFIMVSYLVLGYFIVDDANELGELLDCPNVGTLSDAELEDLASQKLEELLNQLNSFGSYSAHEVEHGLAVKMVRVRKTWPIFGLALPDGKQK